MLYQVNTSIVFHLSEKHDFPEKNGKEAIPFHPLVIPSFLSIDMAVNWGLPPIFRHTIFSAISAVCFGNALRCFGGTVRLWKPHRREQRRMGFFYGIFAFRLTLVFFPRKVPLDFWGLGCISGFLWRNTDELVGYGFTRLGWRKAPQVTKELVAGRAGRQKQVLAEGFMRFPRKQSWSFIERWVKLPFGLGFHSEFWTYSMFLLISLFWSNWSGYLHAICTL